jgi:hypothetical protein
MSRFRLPIFLIILILISSCSLERKIARQFNQQAADISILTLRTDFVFKIPEKEIKGSNKLPEEMLDSIRMSKTLVLQHLHDEDEFLSNFFTQYVNELRRYGVKVYQHDEFESFFGVDTNAWVVNLAQLEIEEFDYPFRVTEVFGGTMYTFDYTINGIIFNTWFELSKVNDSDNAKPEILFASNHIYDEFYGNFHQNFFTGEVTYRLKHDTITVEDFLNYTANMGRLYAAYTYDYLLNTHLDKNIDPNKRSQLWYRYDPYRKILFNTDEDKFIPLDN